MFRIFLTRRATKDLNALPSEDRERVAEKIALLGHNPDSAALDVKRLRGEPFYRLRVGHWRVVFDRQDAVRIIEIVRVKHRREAYR